MSKNKETADNPVEKADSNQFTPKVYTDSVTKEYSGGTPKQNHKTNELKEKAEAKASFTYAGPSSYAGPASASSLPHESSSTYAGPASITNLPHESSEMNDGGDDDQSSSTSREFTTIFSRDSPPASSDDTNFYARISNILDDETPQPLPSFSWVYNNWDNNNLTLPPLNHPLQSNASGLDAIEPNSQPTGPGSPF
ncbi:hypothetical protein RclHR1_05300010 [Rhizophagus clarus]|uniref:Uncharacterized protein n=1 Tax=Rhizophagus clarus TaxID=94130 RepID=A0A2Z6SF58_9GLOM|nr:hypothetical protein RclHR1_05300010 [Rhizophagus clarus]